MSVIEKTFYHSLLGDIEITGSHGVIFSVHFLDEAVPAQKVPPGLAGAIAQLDEYFSGKRKHFELSLQPNGTPFQRHVWDELLNIPFGKTTSYLQLARKLGDEKSIRAAAAANGRN